MIIRITILLFISFNVIYAQEVVFSSQITLTNESTINTKHSEFSPMLFGHDLIYIKRSDTLSSITREEHYDIFIAGVNLKNELINSALLSPTINTDFHEGPAFYDPKNSELYYSTIDPQDSLSGTTIPPSKIMVARYDGTEFANPVPTTHNLEKTSSVHPTISQDGIWLVFASDREDGFGKMDLYMSVRNEASWSDPVNLGGLINTDAAEVFPYIDEALNLFFARKNEKTGLDLYLSVFHNGHYLDPVKLPEPINSEFDDFGLCLNENENIGYFSSNRPGGQGEDDIYRLNYGNSLFDIQEEKGLTVTVRHQKNKTPISNALINIRKLDDLELSGVDPLLYKLNPVEIFDSLRTNSEGKAIVESPLQSFLIEVTYPNMKNWNKIYIQNASRRNIEIFLTEEEETIENNQKQEQVNIKDEDLKIGSILTFENIYYSYNSYHIEEGAAYELDALVEYLKANPRVEIELISHTDSRGEASYNQILSDKRAASAKDYLQLKGIHTNRIKYSGKGESEIRNHCKDGVQCSDEEHNYNRRTEVIILTK